MMRTFLLALAACEIVVNVDAPGRAEQLCLRQCENGSDGANCNTLEILEECASLCSAPSVSDEPCIDELEALVNCERNQPFECNGSVSVNGVDWPVLVNAVECSVADALYADCQSVGYTLR